MFIYSRRNGAVSTFIAMATTPLISALSFLVFSLFISQFLINPTHGDQPEFGRRLSSKKDGLRKEKLTHFRVYFHDIVSGPNPSAVMVVTPPSNASTTRFGMIAVIDDPLTMGPELDSKLVGRAQGLYSSSSQTEVGLLAAMNFLFVEGKYNGSTISILGRNAVMSQVREMPIIGGSGLFRFARGYVQARTHTYNVNNGDAVVEYNVFVLHY